MKDPYETFVCYAVAQHLGIDPSAIRAFDRFTSDLALQPLDIVIIALRIEALENIVIPMEQLEHVATVAELARLVRRLQIGKPHLDRPLLVPFARPWGTPRRRAWVRRLVA